MVVMILVGVIVGLSLGLLGAVGIGLFAGAVALIWFIVLPAAGVIIFGLLGAILSAVFQVLAPETWQAVNRDQIEQRRRKEFFDNLEREMKSVEVPRRKQADRRPELCEFRPQFGSLSGPQVRPTERVAEYPHFVLKNRDGEPHA